MSARHNNKLFCFSPPVMVATFIIEVVLAVYVLFRYKLNQTGRVIVAMLLCLAAFQLAEYYVCTNSSIAITASRIGFVGITLLPALGLYLMSLLTKTLSKNLIISIFSLTALVAGYFLIAPEAFKSYECTGNYVIFQIGLREARLYSMFYFGLIGWTLALGLRYIHANPKAKSVLAIKWLIAGYVLFMLPVAALIVIHPDTSYGIPSVLCGFAIITAVILATRIAPLSLNKKS